MAIDKAVDSTLLDAACAYEAAKIRAKTGGSAQIAYDLANGKGFGDAIDAIPTGGGEALTYLIKDGKISDGVVINGVGGTVITEESSTPNYVKLYGQGNFYFAADIAGISKPTNKGAVAVIEFVEINGYYGRTWRGVFGGYGPGISFGSGSPPASAQTSGDLGKTVFQCTTNAAIDILNGTAYSVVFLDSQNTTVYLRIMFAGTGQGDGYLNIRNLYLLWVDV